MSLTQKKKKTIFFFLFWFLAVWLIGLLFNSLTVTPNNQVSFPTGYNKPDDLFFAFLKEDNPYISQTIKEHFYSNGYLATDVATDGKELKVYAPSYLELSEDGYEKDLEKEYNVMIVENNYTMGLTVELHWIENSIKKSFAIGHMGEVFVENGSKVSTGDILGISGGCPGKLKLNEKSSGCHIHIEYRVCGKPTVYPEYLYNNHNSDLDLVNLWQLNKKDSEAKIKNGLALKHDDPIYERIVKDKILARVVSEVHNQENGRCAKNCQMSLAGARGQMQFIKNTWGAYGCDGDGDGISAVENLSDAICGAGNYLKTLFESEKRVAPDLADKWIWWRAVYRYNAGYSRPATHKDGIPSAVKYADDIINRLNL